eukprot:SAG22_NODE_1537_length_4188_cov_108.843238_2_plen_69_part_00
MEKNIEKACYYFKLAAENGDAEGAYCYGQRLKKGQGVAKNVVEAVVFFKKVSWTKALPFCCAPTVFLI